MEKPEKKEKNPKAGKKKEARKEDTLAGVSEQLERAFTKKIKALVKEVKKETKKEIKNIMNAARQKIRDGAAEIVEDLLKTAKVEIKNIDLPDQKQAEIAPESNAVTPPEADNKVQSATPPAVASPKKATSRNRKNAVLTDNNPKPSARTRIRKTPAAETGTTNATETE